MALVRGAMLLEDSEMPDPDQPLDYELQSFAHADKKEARKRLMELFRSTPLPLDHLMVNLGLYQRSSVVAKLLYLNELYQKIVDIPGVIMELGVWWGQTLVQLLNLRAVYEPYNHTRRVIGFDTFEGYPEPLPQDGSSKLVRPGQYAVSRGYSEYLRELMAYHEEENSMPRVKKFELVRGDAAVTSRQYLEDHPETIIALAYFDMQLYAPTKTCLEAILPHLVKGSVIAMDDLNSGDFPGETLAFREAIGLQRFQVKRSAYLPDRTYFIVE